MRDFLSAFTIIRSILGTYNPRSPYVTLDMWLYPRMRCAACRGEMPMEGFAGVCAACTAALCEGCQIYCSFDDEYVCPRCARERLELMCDSCSDQSGCTFYGNMHDDESDEYEDAREEFDDEYEDAREEF